MKNILPVIFIVSSITFIIGLGHFVVYKSFLMIFDIKFLKMVKITRVFFILGSVSFVAMTFITNVMHNKVSAFFYEMSAIWLGTVYFLFIASVLFLLIHSIGHLLNIPVSVTKIIGMLLLFTGLGISIYGIINTYNIKTTNYTVKINNLPDGWNNKKIVMFADTHFGNIRNVSFGKKLVKIINEKNPDLVLIVGDYFDGPKVNTALVTNILKEIDSTNGVVFAPGNHEEYGDNEEFNKYLNEAGVVTLNDNTINVEGIQISGVTYKTGSNKELLSSTINNMNLIKEIPQILIKHAPNNLDAISLKGFDLVVSGHVHQGQVWPGPLITKKIFKEFAYGLNYLNKTAVVTTSGAGTWGPPQRVGTNSEIVVIRLEK